MTAKKNTKKKRSIATKLVTRRSASTRSKARARIQKITQQPVKQKMSASKIQALRLKQLLSVSWGRVYELVAVLVLLGTTAWWALLGARLQQVNADQLVDTYLFGHGSTLHDAIFPGAHTFLFKWPLFFGMNVAHTSPLVFELCTIALCLVAVGFFAFVLWRINQRSAVFGTLCLALASVLLLVPAVPYAGALLPVNMAMLTTRNIEYVFFLGSLILLIRSPRIKSVGFWLAVTMLGLLIASDKLFLSLSVGGGIISLLFYVIAKRKEEVRVTGMWLVVVALAVVSSTVLLQILSATGLTHITAGQSATPYALTHELKQLVLGVIFGVMGLGTNFGANPAYDAAVLRTIPTLLKERLFSLALVGYVANILTFGIGMYAAVCVVLTSARRRAAQAAPVDTPAQLAVLLLAASIAAFGSFVVTNHYYFVDARYLTVTLFAVFVALATWLRGRQLKRAWWIALATGLACAAISGVWAAGHMYRQQEQALADVGERTILIQHALSHHPVSTVVGDYWRVLPLKDGSVHQDMHIMPLDGCAQPRVSLTSTAWRPDLARHSFAYLLSFDKSLTNYPNCTIKQVIDAYGRPNASTLIAGTVTQPKEVLLYYDHGIDKNVAVHITVRQATAVVLPITPEQLPTPTCDYTLMNVVAHQDDDLLFLSPDLLHDIDAGHCVRTVYITAGDAGHDKLYWQSRERGSEAAYDSQLGNKAIWEQRTLKLNNHEFITVANPRDNPRVSLLFLRLPDGNIRGQGFSASNFESLQQLEAGGIVDLHAVDSQSEYTLDDLSAALVQLMSIYRPVAIHTQAPYSPGDMFKDHSDHMAVGRITESAHAQYDPSGAVPIDYYFGYPIRAFAPNVPDGDMQRKANAFFAYARFDGGVCRTLATCDEHSYYGAFLWRQYNGNTPR